MPSKRKSNKNTEPDFDDDYRKKRERNNQAVKRSREKSKQNTIETLQKVQDLRDKNKELESKIKNLSKELKFLKDLFIAQAKAKTEKYDNIDLKKLLMDDEKEDEELDID